MDFTIAQRRCLWPRTPCRKGTSGPTTVPVWFAPNGPEFPYARWSIYHPTLLQNMVLTVDVTETVESQHVATLSRIALKCRATQVPLIGKCQAHYLNFEGGLSSAGCCIWIHQRNIQDDATLGSRCY